MTYGSVYGNRTRDTALRGLWLNRLPNTPFRDCLFIILYMGDKFKKKVEKSMMKSEFHW